MTFFTTNDLPQFIDFMNRLSGFERAAVAKTELNKRLLLHECTALKELNRRQLITRLTQPIAA